MFFVLAVVVLGATAFGPCDPVLLNRLPDGAMVAEDAGADDLSTELIDSFPIGTEED